jgi:hypothetical protein
MATLNASDGGNEDGDYSSGTTGHAREVGVMLFRPSRLLMVRR